ncbi:MAG TPA: hypothetical protein VF515_04835 [Candidatus Binatia bacterium]
MSDAVAQKDFKAVLDFLKSRGEPFTVALPSLGLIRVKITDIRDDLVVLQTITASPEQKLYLHYASIIVVT